MQQMYQDWPFFQSTMDLIEMILSKCDMRIAALYDHRLAETEEEKALGVVLRGKYEETVKAVLEVKLYLAGLDALSLSQNCIALPCPVLCMSGGRHSCQLHELCNVLLPQVSVFGMHQCRTNKLVACFVSSLVCSELAWSHSIG